MTYKKPIVDKTIDVQKVFSNLERCYEYLCKIPNNPYNLFTFGWWILDNSDACIVIYNSKNPKQFEIRDKYDYTILVLDKKVNKHRVYHDIIHKNKLLDFPLSNKSFHELEINDFINAEDYIFLDEDDGEIRFNDNSDQGLINKFMNYITDCDLKLEPHYIKDSEYTIIKKKCFGYIKKFNLCKYSEISRKLKIEKIKSRLIEK